MSGVTLAALVAGLAGLALLVREMAGRGFGWGGRLVVAAMVLALGGLATLMALGAAGNGAWRARGHCAAAGAPAPPLANPCKGTPRYKRKPMERFLANYEYARLATALRDYEAEQPLYVAAIRLLIFTGARCGEIEQLRWEWVQEPRLMLPDSKTGAKIVYLNGQAIDLIASLLDRKASGLLFPSFRNPEKPITLGIHWSKIRNRAALPDVRLHDLRHSFA